MQAHCIRLNGHFGNALFYEYRHEGISFRYSVYNIAHPAIMKARANERALELRIALQNEIKGSCQGIKSPALLENRFSLSFTPFVQTRAEFQGNHGYATCDFHFEYHYLVRMAADFPELSEFLEQVEQDKPTHLFNKSFICNNVMLESILYIRKNPFSARSQKHIFTNCAKEILLAALEIISGDIPGKPVLLTSRLLDALHHAKLFIELNVEEDISLSSLCKVTGLSEYLLKKGFKSIYGVSPIRYQIGLKMDKAKVYLLESDMDIAEIAYTLRYHYPSNFSLEFKRRFGCSPKHFKKHGRL
jgi:AraC-like DNA-binding protein